MDRFLGVNEEQDVSLQLGNGAQGGIGLLGTASVHRFSRRVMTSVPSEISLLG